ncbi:MAG TPA: HEAT repeat domain-containing protein, partial [Ktedonobacteraceae bacterium]|nr:HEAT repeat domain-containing protein [Ktedonobacteraceae bacterium]
FRELLPFAEAMLHGAAPAGVFASRTRCRIAEAIGAINRAEPSLLAMLETLLDWPYWQVRMKAAEAFSKIRRNIPETAIERLLTLRFDPEPRAVRQAADRALAEIISLENRRERN